MYNNYDQDYDGKSSTSSYNMSKMLKLQTCSLYSYCVFNYSSHDKGLAQQT